MNVSAMCENIINHKTGPRIVFLEHLVEGQRNLSPNGVFTLSGTRTETGSRPEQ